MALLHGKRTRWVHDAEVDQLVGECSGAPAVITRQTLLPENFLAAREALEVTGKCSGAAASSVRSHSQGHCTSRHHVQCLHIFQRQRLHSYHNCMHFWQFVMLE